MRFLAYFFLIPCPFLCQEGITSNDFFHMVNKYKPEQIQTVKITDNDTIIYVTHKYSYRLENNTSYLISTTFDSDSLITSYLKEEITKKGLKYIASKNYEYDEFKNQKVLEVKGKKKITFPFKNIR